MAKGIAFFLLQINVNSFMLPKNCRNWKITLEGHCQGHCLLSHISVYCFCSSCFHSSCQGNVGTGRLLLKDMAKDIVFFYFISMFLNSFKLPKNCRNWGITLEGHGQGHCLLFHINVYCFCHDILLDPVRFLLFTNKRSYPFLLNEALPALFSCLSYYISQIWPKF